jgi:hypothetical protein
MHISPTKTLSTRTFCSQVYNNNSPDPNLSSTIIEEEPPQLELLPHISPTTTV